MLVLTRKINQSIIVGDDVEITVLDIRGEQVRVGINAPKSITVYRKEIYEQIQQENHNSSKTSPDDLPE